MTNSEKLQQLIEEAEMLVQNRVNASDPKFAGWHLRTKNFLRKKFGDESDEVKHFRGKTFRPIMTIIGGNSSSGDDTWVKYCISELKRTIEELKVYLEDIVQEQEPIVTDTNVRIKNLSHEKVFIVHGHDNALKADLARLIEKQGIEAIILSEQANSGKTIIEKFEEHSNVGAAIALFTNDDLGRLNQEGGKEASRARQNVVFEAGYFMGKLGRNRVILIAEKGVELPSDLQGVVYADTEHWQFEVCKELKNMGYNIDLNKLV